MNHPVIVSAVRTPVGKLMGALAPVTAPKLGAIAIKEALRRAGVAPELVEEVIMGCVVQAGVGQAPARQAAIHAGLWNGVGALTINKVCGSGLRAVSLAAQVIKAGDADIVVAGGMESMSNCPHLLPKSRNGFRYGNVELVDSIAHDGLTNAFDGDLMGAIAEDVAAEYKIDRAAQDAFAAESHRRAIAAMEAGAFKDEIVPVEIPDKKGTITVSQDEGPRKDTTAESLAKLKPAFKKDGTVTAGNAPSINDGAAAVVVMSERKAKELGLTPIARIVGYSTSHLEPRRLFTAPVEAVRSLAKKTGVAPGAFDIAELNEAFSVQALACVRDLELDAARVNPSGGAVALGHPIGASGARILTTLLYGLRRSGKQRGVASLCLGGGGAVALGVEMM